MSEMTKKKIVAASRLLDRPGVKCPGCETGTVTRIICEVIEELGLSEDEIIAIDGIGCAHTSGFEMNVDCSIAAHGRAPAAATGVKRVRPEALVFTCQGDGDLVAIGLGTFMHAMIRGEKITTFMYNNLCFSNTGGQMSPTTLSGMHTSTTPYGRAVPQTGYPLHTAEMAATVRGVAYSARVSVHTPANFQRAKQAVKTAFRKQIDGIGYSLVEFLVVCPPNWGLSPLKCLDFIEEKVIPEYPLGEFKNVDEIV